MKATSHDATINDYDYRARPEKKYRSHGGDHKAHYLSALRTHIAALYHEVSSEKNQAAGAGRYFVLVIALPSHELSAQRQCADYRGRKLNFRFA